MNTKFLKRKHTNHQEHQISNSDELKNMLNDIADLPGCIEKINQKIQNIEKHISKKTFDTNKVKALLQSQEQVNNNNINNEALNLKNIVKASVDNVSDVLNFDKKKKYKQMKQNDVINNNNSNNIKTTLKKTDTKKKMIAMNNNVINNNKKDIANKNNKQLEMSSDNLLKNNNVNSNSTSKKYSNSQNSFIYCENNNVVKLNSKYDMKINPNEINEEKYKTSKNLKNEINEKSPNNKNTYNNGNASKNFCFKPKVKKIVNEITDNIQKITENNLNLVNNNNNNDTNINTTKTGISITNPNNDIITNNNHNNNNNNSKQNKSFIERNHFKKNNNLKGNAEYKKPITAHPNQHSNINVNHSNKNSDLQNSNLKLNTFKLPSKHLSNSLKNEHINYNKEIPKNINIEDIVHFMLFYNEYIISNLPKQASQNVKDTLVNYSNVLAKLISIPKQSHIDLVQESDRIQKILCIQRKWREYKVKKLARNNNNKVECELKQMLVNNFIEKETLMRKVIGLLNTSLETFSQAKNKEMFVLKLIKLSNSNNNNLSDDEKNIMYKEYINSKLHNEKRNTNNNKYNGGDSMVFNGNDDKLSYRLLSSIVSIQDTPQK